MIILVIMVSCKTTAANQVENNADVPIFENDLLLAENGNFLLISTPEPWNTFKIGDSIGLFFQNLSSKGFTYNYSDIKMYWVDDGKWSEVKNKAISVGNDTVVLEPMTSNNASTAHGEFVDPDISYNKRTYLKIIITGNHLLENGSLGDEISVYIDIELNP
jgi:hypothetical protein